MAKHNNYFLHYSSRNSSIELLRVVFMMLIMLIHAYGHGSGLDYDWIYSLGADSATAYHLGLFSIGKVGVTGFMFISGYYGIKFHGGKLWNMLSMLLFYLLIVEIVAGVNFFAIFQSLLHPWDQWWFVSCYLLVFILSPIINTGIEKLTEKQFRFIVLGMLLYTYVGHFIMRTNSQDLELLLTIFLAARYVRLYGRAVWQKYSGVCALVLAGVLFFSPILLSQVGGVKIHDIFLSNNNILLLLFSASLVMYWDKHPFHNGFINYLASSTLAIYLLTDNVLRTEFDPWLLGYVMDGVQGFLLIAAIAVGCLLADKIREGLFGVVKRIFTKQQ